jgi:hypothetical protein
MKTTNITQKTEKRTIENSLVKTLAVVICFVLISLTGIANGYLKHLRVNNNFGKTTIQMDIQENGNLLAFASPGSVFHSSEMTKISSNFFNETASDNKLEVENWMINDSYFNANLVLDQEMIDAPLRMENWMLSNSNFSASDYETESESALKIESWMTNETNW